MIVIFMIDKNKNFEKYFFNQIVDFDEATLLSPNIGGNKTPKLEKCELKLKISELNQFCSENQLSENILFLASVNIALTKFNFSSKNLIFHENNIPFACIFENRDISVKDYLDEIKEIHDGNLRFINCPVDRIIKDYNLKPEFYYSFNQDLDVDSLNFKYSTYLNILESDGEFILSMQYNDQLYSQSYINLFLESIQTIINYFINNNITKLTLSDISLVEEYENVQFDEVELPFLHKRFEKEVNKNPDNIAIVASDATLTYGEFNKKANRIANALIKRGIGPKSNVLVMLPRTSDLIASIMGILKAGCAFIPIDLEYPKDRIDYIYTNSQADYIISNTDEGNSLNIADLLNEEDTNNPDVDISEHDTAYMIYTSGSTGNPKGVMISHENICNQVQNPKSKYSSLLCLATISFDVSLDDILTSLSNGLKLILASDTQIKNIPELIKLLNDEKPEVSEVTPSRLASYLEVDGFCRAIGCLKCVFMGGEAFSTKVFETFRKYSDAIVYNSYGPTETTITSNNKEVTDVNDITVGLPLHNYVTDVRDIDGKLLPSGVMGELYIGGVGVGKGYYNMPEKTEEVFLAINDIPYYRSGDYAVALTNGEIDIKGRIDNQIKLRGLRIEIGEIESNITKFPSIKQVAVVIKEINNNDHLCAYYTADEKIDKNNLKEFLKDRLTKYMVPTAFMQLDEMPQTPNGKTDLKALPQPKLDLENVAPETELEKKLFNIASNIANTDAFGVTDDLYAIGFTSLLLMKFNAIIYEDFGVNLDIMELLNNPTIRNIATSIEGNEESGIDLNTLIESSKDLTYYPLTSNQLGVYYECAQNPDEAQYNLPAVIRFDNDIDALKLKEAIIKTINAYPYLKTRIVTHDGQLMLKRDDSIEIDDIPIIEIDDITTEEIEKENVERFELQENQLFRAKIYDASKETVLFFDMHHIITDGESLDNLFNNIALAYEGKEIEKEAIDGYVNSMIEKLDEDSEEYIASEKYFHDELTKEVDSTILTPNLNGNDADGKLLSIYRDLNPDLVKEFCSEMRISPNVLFMAGTILTLNKYTFTDKTLITTIFNGRLNPNYFNTQAFLVRTIPILSINEDRNITIRQLLNQMDEIWKDSIKHSNYPYTKIAEEFQLKPEFMYTYNNLDSEKIHINGKIYDVSYLESLETNYKITLDVNESEDNLQLFISYNDQLYTEDYIKSFLNSIVNTLTQFMENDIEKLRINEIELNKDYELPTFTPVENPFIHKRFEKQVIENPDDIALVATDATFTKEEFNKKANRIANALIKKGVKPKSNVLVMLPRTSDLIASMMGIFKAGCAYIPIDLEYPKERINYIFENSQADFIISDKTEGNMLDIKELLQEENDSNPDIEMSPDDLVYMIYTSGSTGNPKGVMISHENICNEINNHKINYESILCITTISFDVAMEDILTSLGNGIKLIFADDRQIKDTPKLIQLINDNKPEVMDLTPSRLASYLEVDAFCKAISCVKCMVLGGEAFSTKVFETFRKYSDAIVYNSYGPTETTITSNNKIVTDANDITVGVPLHNYVTDVRDIDGKLLPLGVMGELYIGGVGVGKGYYNMPEKTEEVFLEIDDIPYYRSGDYAIARGNGEIDIKGRIDNQIKLRGLRIEIGEIESNISKYPSIKQCVVVIKEINNNDHLCAYYVADEKIEVNSLKEFLKDKLTKYMVPTAYMQLDEMPQTPNGKTDLKALPEPELDLEYVKPENETEEKLFEMAVELINTDKFGTTDDLYAIGFTSLILMKFNSLIYEEMQANLDISVLFDNPTIKKLADEIMGSSDEDSDLAEVVELAKSMDYLPLTENQLGVYYECAQNPGEIKYTMPTTIRFDSSVDADKLKESAIKAIEAHPYLKTRIVIDDEGEIKQKRNDDGAIDEIEIVEVSSISDDEIIENDVKAFSFGNEQLFRFKIYKTPEETVLFFDIHHLITDGVSQINLFDDIANIYDGGDASEEIVDGYTYSLLENNLKDTDKYESAKKFFDDILSHETESTVLTPNLNGNPDEGKLKSVIENMGSEGIKEFCNDNSLSQNAVFLSCLTLSLNKYTFSDKTLITTIFNGRSNPYYYNTQGFLVKTIPLVFNNENRQVSIKEFINYVERVWKDTVNNSIYPYTNIAQDYQLKPEFFFTYQEFLESEDITINGKAYEEQELGNEDLLATEYKINFDLSVFDDDIELRIDYNNALYTEDYIKKFLDSFKLVLNQFIENDIDDLMICDVELETTKELPKFTPVENPFIHKRFEKQVIENPDDIALVATDATFTNDELNKKANRIANALIKKGVKPKSNVLSMLPRDSNLIATIIGILKAGCTFIPIDLEYPKDRIDYIYNNSQADYIITDDGNADNALNIHNLLEEDDDSNPDVDISPDDLAYMIYTSGSTGNPKGVMISHKNACNQAEGNPKCEYDNLLSIATIAFDTSLEDILTGITNGIKIIFANDSEIKNIVELIELIRQHEPEVMEFTPSRLLSYLDIDDFCDVIGCAKCIVMGGEQFSAKAFEGVKKYCDAHVYNSYGPTEATIASNYKEITDPYNITVGKALKNYVTEVRDIDGKLLPQGVMGELYIGGVGVGKGYYNMEDKTREVYLYINEIPYYKSGDYAIELPDGEIDIKGRIDNQIKLRGLRIEIGEIESNISRFPAINRNIVVIKEINGTEHLCAYFTADEKIDINLLKRYLNNKLTKYMVPTVFVQIYEMPQTPNGKTDIKALPEPILDFNRVEAQTDTEKLLFKMVSSMTDVDGFGVTDDLYALGFTSLTLMKLNSLIYNETEVNIEISDLFNNPTVQSLADKIDNNIDTQVDLDEVSKTAEDMDNFPLTTNQLGIYYECAQSDEIKYTMPCALRFDSNIGPEKLRNAIIEAIDAHPYLKTRIITTPEGELRQKRCDDVEIDDIEIAEIDSITNREIMDRDIKYIPLDDNQLFRFKIYKTPKETILFSDFHHIITDGVSQDLLFEDIINAYEGKELNSELVDGFVYSLIEQELSNNEVSKTYYQNKFAQGFESTVLTPNLNGNPDEAIIKLYEDSMDSTFVRLFCKDHSISPNVLFMSATFLALNKFTFSDKALITTIFNGRSNSNYFDTQGMLVKTLPLMVSGENREMMVEDFIKDVDRSWKESLVHSNYSYTALSEEYQLKPEFFYAYHGAFETDNLELEGKEYEMIDLDGTVATDYKINMDVFDDGKDISLYIEYNDQIYSKDYVAKFLNAVKHILFQFFINDMDKLRIGDIELASKFDLVEFEEVVNPFLHKRFEAQVDKKADEIALVAEESLTYSQLNEKANRIANSLIEKGVKPRSNILIMLPRNSDLIASIIGVLKAGCAFIPLDLKFPKERIEYIYENSQADYIINVDGDTLNSISINDLLEQTNINNPDVTISKDDLSYMIYTSGSTGNPKGVMISHENACNQVEGNPKAEYNNLLSIATIAFDTSLEDILTGITNGIKIIFANDDEIKSIVELIRLIKREEPEVMEFTPSRLLSYLEFDEFCDVIGCAKCIVMGGEQFSAKAFDGVKKYCDAHVFNSYGPTEATIASNYKEITDPDNITIGKALRNYITEVRDIDGKLLPQGVMGELYIGGIGVGKGYYNMGDKTREVYLTIDDIPYYKSGDYAIELPDGDIDIKGRIDNQIKLRGLRIEIGEIESNISNFPNIKQNVVVIKEIRNNEHLCAYFTAEEQINKDELKEYLSERLTQYMVPTVFMQVDEMPQTPNGKTDIKALPEPKLELKYVAPETKLEQTICAIYSSILDVEIVGAEDNFFEIGGTSLIASKLIIELLKQDYDVKYDDIFRNQTPRKLASFLSGDEISDDLDIDIIENYDYTTINKLLEKNTFKSFAMGENKDIGNVLLTGVTGFLGIHVLYEYIKNEDGIIYCMLRKGKFDSCEERLADLMDYYFDEDFTDLIGSRIILSEGDITNSEDFNKLDDYHIDTLINCAAIVKHYTHDDYIFRVNVDGVVNGLNFAEANDATYVQISTTSVIDEYVEDADVCDVACDERTLYWGQDLSNKYLNSKFLAERMVLEKAVNGLDVKIIRVGNLMARYSDGIFQKNFDTNAFLNNIKAIKNLKAINPSLASEMVEISPIDCVAKATLLLSTTPKDSTIFHCENDKLISNQEIIDALNSFGFDIKNVSSEEFKEIYEQNMNENIQGIITADLTLDDLDFDEEGDDGSIVKMDQTLDILDSLGFEWPVIDEDYLKRFIKFLNEVNYFD